MSHLLPIADFGGVFGCMIVPVLALCIPLVLALTRHQQRMAEIMRGGSVNDQLVNEVHQLRHEMNGLKEIVHQQAIALDDKATLRKLGSN